MTVHTLYSTGLRSGLLGGHVSEVRRLVSQQLGKSHHNVDTLCTRYIECGCFETPCIVLYVEVVI